MSEANETQGAAKTAAPGGGGMKAFLPLILVVVLMPVLAFVMTNFVLLPKLQKALGVEAVSAREGGDEPEKGAKSEGGGETKHGSAGGAQEGGKGKGPKVKVALSKVIVNVSGSLGTRMLLASFTLAGSSAEFKAKVEDNTDQLRDMAASVLSSKTISDLEKPESRNLIRAELISQFNTVLGGGLQEIYLTEFAIQ